MQEVSFPTYIGLSDITNSGQFRWVDGTPVDYTNWDGREPNEVGGEVSQEFNVFVKSLEIPKNLCHFIL